MAHPLTCKAALRVVTSYTGLVILLVSTGLAMAPGEQVEGSGQAVAAGHQSRGGAAPLASAPGAGDGADVKSYIIAGSSVDTVAERVEGVGGKVTHELGIIRAVAAELNPKQLEALKKSEPKLKIRSNRTLEVKDDSGG